MVNKRLKHEIDGMIGESELFNDEQKQKIFRKIQMNDVDSTIKPKRFSMVAFGATMAVASIFVVLLLSQFSLDPNNGGQSTPGKSIINDESEDESNETKDALDEKENQTNDVEENKKKDRESEYLAAIDGKVYNSLRMPDDLKQIYQQYIKTYDESLLKGLTPFDIFRLFHQAKIDTDNRTIYELYYKDKELTIFPYESFEAYEAEIPSSISESEKEYNQKIMTVNQFKIEVLSVTEIIVKYEDPIRGNPISFRIVKNSNGIWKVPFMPIQ